MEKQAKKKTIRHEDLFELHRILADSVMAQGTAGSYRTIEVRVGRHFPPAAAEVSGLMFELGRPPGLPRRAGRRARGRRKSNWLAGVLYRGCAPDAGKGLTAGADLQRQITGETRAAAQTGIAAEAAARPRQPLPCRTLGDARGFQTGRDGSAAPAAGGRAGGKNWRQEDRTIFFENPMNEAETRAEHIDPALKAAGPRRGGRQSHPAGVQDHAGPHRGQRQAWHP